MSDECERRLSHIEMMLDERARSVDAVREDLNKLFRNGPISRLTERVVSMEAKVERCQKCDPAKFVELSVRVETLVDGLEQHILKYEAEQSAWKKWLIGILTPLILASIYAVASHVMGS